MKAQVSAEFVMTTGLMAMLFIFGIAVYQEQHKSQLHMARSYDQKALAWNLARAIDAVHDSGNGSSTLIFAKRENYSIEIGNGTVYVIWKEQVAEAPIVTKNTTGSVTTGGHINISNSGGVVNVANQ